MRILLLLIDAGAPTPREALLARVPGSIRGQVVEVLAYEGSNRGESQILGFRHAIERGYDVVAVLRADGQDAPEALPDLLEPLASGAADAVFGVRAPADMPLARALAQRARLRFESTMLGTSFGEFNPGYRLYACAALKRIPFEKNARAAHFDAQIIIQLRGTGSSIVVRSVPRLPHPEPSLQSSLTYAKGLLKSVIGYELHEFGLHHHPEYVVPPAHTMKRSELSSHSQLLQLVGPPPQRILDVGCGQGELGHVLKQRGHYVVGVDWSPPRFELDAFVQADVALGLPSAIPGKFDVILLADVLEHMAEPLKLLEDTKERLQPGGRLLVSLPNVAHWSMRAQLAVGRFDYTNKGLLDRGHLRFFTRASALRLFQDAGLDVVSRRTTPVPWEHVLPRALGSFIRDKAERADYFLTRARPNLFAYQNLFELRVARAAQP